MVQHVSDAIQEYIIQQNGNRSSVFKATQVTVDNNVCVKVFNDLGRSVYDVDSIGTGCVFHQPSSVIENSPVSLRDGNRLKEYLQENNGEVQIQVVNSRTEQEMIVFGRTIQSNLGNFYLFVNSPLEPVDSIVSFFSQQYVIYTIVIVALASIISMLISRSITRPIITMQKEADKLANADYSAHFEGGSFTETKELAATLNGAKEQLSKVDNLRKDLIANVSHDIKTPLTSIKAYAEMIKDISGDNPQKRDEHLDVIIDETDYLNHLVTDMSELSRMQSGNYTLKYSNFDLAEKIRDVVQLNEVMIKEGNLNVILNIPESLTIFADEVKMGQVIYNYLSNAIKHSPDGKSITINAYLKEDDEIIRVEVIDEGDGIEEEDLPLIWDRYQKSSQSFSRNVASTGLGLSIVKAILDTHHAKYGVISKRYEGSTFWFEISRSPKIDGEENE